MGYRLIRMDGDIGLCPENSIPTGCEILSAEECESVVGRRTDLPDGHPLKDRFALSVVPSGCRDMVLIDGIITDDPKVISEASRIEVDDSRTR